MKYFDVIIWYCTFSLVVSPFLIKDVENVNSFYFIFISYYDQMLDLLFELSISNARWKHQGLFGVVEIISGNVLQSVKTSEG